jgi:hypothetical protein
MKHTPEPWELKQQYSADSNGSCIYKITKQGDYWPIIPECSTGENFARIVACVNACAGMDDPELVIRWMKSIPVGKDYGPDLISLLKEMEKLKAQRDELLKSLELFTLLNPNHYRDIAGLINKAVEVVSKTKGINP